MAKTQGARDSDPVPVLLLLLNFGLEFSTKGGLNEQVFADFDQKGGTKAPLDALDRVHRRVRG